MRGRGPAAEGRVKASFAHPAVVAKRAARRPAGVQGAERQADLAAARVRRGERDVRDVGHAPAAAAPDAASLGAPLPGDLLRRLEFGFGADLSAVRLHTDLAAAEATEREGARAFAAGRDVYLGRDARTDLRAERGFRTLTHEVAHVLQQTGRPDRDGRPVARDVAGSAGADVQREDLVEYVDQYEGYFHQDRPRYQEIKKAYEKVPGVDIEVRETDKIYPYGFDPAYKEDHDRLVARTKADAFGSLPVDVRAFYVDCLKAVKRYADAAEVFKKLPPTTATVFRSKEMYLELRKDLAWLGPFARVQPFTKQLYPSGILDVFRHYFYGPVQIIVFPLPDYDKRSFEEKTRISSQASSRKDSEFSLMTVHAMDRLVSDQRNSLAAFGAAITSARPDEEKLRVVEAYATRKVDDPTIGAPATEPELRALYDDLWPALKTLAEGARAYWRRIKILDDAVFYGYVFETMSEAEVAALGKEVGANPAFAALDGVLVKAATALVNVDPLPGPAAYRERMEAQREALRTHTARYGAALIDLARKEKRNKTDDRQMLRLGLVLRRVLDLRERFAGMYDYAADVVLTKQGHDDQRLAARLLVAKWLLRTGLDLGLTQAVAAAGRFLAKDTPQLALLSDWALDTKPVGPVDYQGDEISTRAGTGLTNTRISQFFFADYLGVLATAIETALDPSKNPQLAATVGGKSILAEAIKIVKAVDRPQRYLMERYEYWYDPAGAVKVVDGKTVSDPAKRWSGLVFRHWRTQQLTSRLPVEAEQTTSISPPKSRGAPITLWNVPRMDRVVTRLMKIKPLDDQIQAYLSRTSGGVRIFFEGMEWAEWLGGLDGLAKVLRDSKALSDKQKLGDISGLIGGALDTDYEGAKQRFYRAARRATAAQIRPLLERYRDNERDNAWVPEYVFDHIGQLAAATQIDADQPVQATLLALELADDLSRTFNPKNLYWTFSVLGTLARYTAGAAAVWSDPKLQPEVRKGKQLTATDAELEKQAATLTKMRDVLGKALFERQREDGLTGRMTTGGAAPNTNGEIGTLQLLPTLEAGKSFMMYLREWELLKVHADFDFVPGYAAIESLGVQWPHPEAAQVGESMVLDASPSAKLGTRLPPATKLVTLRRRTLQPRSRNKKEPRGLPGPWETIVITAGDAAVLGRLYRDFGDFSGLEYIRVAGEAIEWIVERELDLAEFIPGIGQGITVGRFIAAVVAFLDSDEFEQLVDAFKKDGFEAIPKLVEKVAGLLKPSAARLFSWFFFGRPTMIQPPPQETSHIQQQQQKAASGGIWSKLARVIRNVAHFAKKLLGTVESLRNRAQAPFRAAQKFVLSHPGLALVVSLAVRYFDVLSSLVMGTLFGDEEEKKDTDFVGRLKNAVKEGINGLAERITGAVNVVREFQLPEEIVPLDLIGEFVIDRVIASLGARYKAIVKGGRAVLESIPGNPWGMITKKVGEGLVDATGADPNKAYQQVAEPRMQEAIDGVRSDVFGWLQSVFSDIGLLKELGIKVDFSPGAKTVIDFAGVEFHSGEEAEPSPASAEHAAPSAGPLHTPSGGDRLPTPMRAHAEASLGHNLAHVRLHRGSEGAMVTGRMHADAITSGSHVFLHPSVSPGGGGRGEHVLHHELGHVLQQTGARPLGGMYADAPSIGRPGRGLTNDPTREAGAERAALRRASPSSAGTPIDVGPPAEGPQPLLNREFVKEMLEQLRDPEQLRSEALDLSPAAVFRAQNALRGDDLNRPVAEKLPAKLAAAFKAMKAADFQPPFDTIADKLKANASSPENEAHFVKMIPVLVASVRERKSPKRVKGQSAPEAAMWLDPARFASELERYLYTLTGIACALSFATKKGPASIGARDVIDLDATTAPKGKAMRVAPFATLQQVGHVHLPFLGDTLIAHELWELLTTNSFSGETGFAGEKELWISATRLAVGHLLPKPGMYLQKKFELSALAKRSVRSQFRRIQPLKAHWPSPADYAKSDSNAVSDKSDDVASHTGIRVGTFGALEAERLASKVEDRDPHHVPQVLLIDYFSNTHKLNVFPHLSQGTFVADLYPGVKAIAGGEVTAIGPIKIQPYTTGTRSDALPAILIAVHTHQAEVHVGMESPDEKSKRVSMGGWVQGRFRTSLGEGLWSVMRDRQSLLDLKAADPARDVTTSVGVRTSRNELGGQIVAGARATYQEMYGEMMRKLKRGLHEQETEYYNLIAASKKSPLSASEKLTTAQVDVPYGQFEKKIDTIMKSSGFKT
jgi:hypothetical protein